MLQECQTDLQAVKWAGALLKTPDDLLKGSPMLPLTAINDTSPEGKLIATFAAQVLGKGSMDAVSIDEAAQAAQTFAAKPFNGDGIVPADSANEAETKALIEDVIAYLGADTDASGKPGVSQAKVDQFFADAAAYSDWWKKAESDKAILPLGINTSTAAAAVKAVRPKVEDFFARCRVAAFDPRALSALNRDEKEFQVIATKDFTAEGAEMAGFPLARVAPGAALPLKDGVNPGWRSGIATLQEAAVKPLLGDKTTLTPEEWNQLLASLAAFEAWSSGRVGGLVDKLGIKRVRELLAGKGKETLTNLIARDKAEQGHADAVGGLNRLVHYYRDLGRLCTNFVSFRDFYGRKAKAIFQAGTLYLDQRSCDLCLSVEDVGKHAAMAGLAGLTWPTAIATARAQAKRCRS